MVLQKSREYTGIIKCPITRFFSFLINQKMTESIFTLYVIKAISILKEYYPEL